MLNSNKVSEIKIIISGLLRDLDSLSDEDVISPLKWEELNIAADNIKQKIGTLMLEHERSSLAKLNQSIVELRRSLSEARQSAANSFVPFAGSDEKSKVVLEPDEEEEMELFFDGGASILDSPANSGPRWMTEDPGPKVNDLNDAITLNDKLFFIGGLFNDDSEQYRLSIQKLNEMASMDEALEYTRAAFEDWDENSEVAYRFYMILRRKLD